jgi:hypothetical protein
MSNVTKTRAVCYLVAIFLAGAACGGLLGYTSGKREAVSPARQKEMSERTLRRLEARLGLTPEQVAKVKPIVDQNSAAMQSIHRESWQRVSETFKQMNAQIAGHLTDAQRTLLEAMENERCENARRKCGAPKGNGAGGSTKDGGHGRE